MQMNDYQDAAQTFLLPSAQGLDYLLPGLMGEVGELASLYAKARRDGNPIDYDILKKELGDCLFFIAAIAEYEDMGLADVALANLQKLTDRKLRNTIMGSGDER